MPSTHFHHIYLSYSWNEKCFRQICRDYQNTHFMFSNFFFRKSCLYEIMWKNTVEPGRPQITIWRMHISCWIPKVTNTLSEYVISLLTAFSLQQWLQERFSVLLNTYIACLLTYKKLILMMRNSE